MKIYIDGSSHGNPGPSGIGMVIYNDEVREYGEYIGYATNNQAEYCALIKALELAAAENSLYVTVYTDSQLLERQINGGYKVKNRVLKRLWERANHLISKFEQFQLIYIPRNLNRRANRLANLYASSEAEGSLNLKNT